MICFITIHRFGFDTEIVLLLRFDVIIYLAVVVLDLTRESSDLFHFVDNIIEKFLIGSGKAIYFVLVEFFLSRPLLGRGGVIKRARDDGNSYDEDDVCVFVHGYL